MNLRKSYRLTWIQAAVVSLTILSVGLLSGCGAEAVKPPLDDPKSAPGAAPGGVSTDDYEKKMKEMKGAK